MSFVSRFANLFRGRKLDLDLEDELRSHMEMRAQDNVEAGMTEQEARLDARRRLGNEVLLHENMRRVRIAHWLETVLQDARFGLRTLRRSPGFTIVAVLIMALTIGATTAVFTLVESILLRPLPYRDPARLFTAAVFMPRMQREITASPDYFTWRDGNHTLAGVAGYDVDNFNFSGAGEPDRIQGAFTTANFFELLGVRPRLGRTYTPDEDKPGAAAVAVITYSFWRGRFHGAADVLGKKILLDGGPTLIIGVLPPQFRFPDASVQPELLVPLQLHEFKADPKQPLRIMKVLGRTRDGVSPVQARSDLQNVSDQLLPSFPAGMQRLFAGRTVNLRSLHSELVGNVKQPLLVALAAVGFVLLIGCLNIASLQLSRAVQRSSEVGIRSALGAAKARLLRQLFTENVILAICGASCGLALAFVAVRFTRSAKLHALPAFSDLQVDGRVLAFAVLVTFLSVLLFGLGPALWSTRADPAKAITRTARSTASAGFRRLRSLVVVTELAIALVLLAGAGLMVHSFARLLAVDPGFSPNHVLTARINMLDSSFPETEQRRAFAQELSQRLRALGDVDSVAMGNSMPLTPYSGGMGVMAEGQPEPPLGTAPIISTVEVLPGYFHALQIPLVAGRDFNGSDVKNSVLVAIVNTAFARQFFPGEDALGKRIRGTRPDSPWVSIVGITGDVHHLGLEKNVAAEIYFPLLQGGFTSNALAVSIRTRDLDGAAAALRKEVRALEANQPVFDVLPLEALLSETLAPRRLSMLLIGSFALLALVLAAIGIYGVLSYSVAQRSQEIGIRMALGSTQARTLRLILGEAALFVVAGVTLGTGGALALTRFMAGLLYRVKPTDPLTLLAASILLMLTGLLAGFLPARRASRVEPMAVLKAE